jgi:hypothetical protein
VIRGRRTPLATAPAPTGEFWRLPPRCPGRPCRLPPPRPRTACGSKGYGARSTCRRAPPPPSESVDQRAELARTPANRVLVLCRQTSLSAHAMQVTLASCNAIIRRSRCASSSEKIKKGDEAGVCQCVQTLVCQVCRSQSDNRSAHLAPRSIQDTSISSAQIAKSCSWFIFRTIIS